MAPRRAPTGVGWAAPKRVRPGAFDSDPAPAPSEMRLNRASEFWAENGKPDQWGHQALFCHSRALVGQVRCALIPLCSIEWLTPSLSMRRISSFPVAPSTLTMR